MVASLTESQPRRITRMQAALASPSPRLVAIATAGRPERQQPRVRFRSPEDELQTARLRRATAHLGAARRSTLLNAVTLLEVLVSRKARHQWTRGELLALWLSAEDRSESTFDRVLRLMRRARVVTGGYGQVCFDSLMARNSRPGQPAWQLKPADDARVARRREQGRDRVRRCRQAKKQRYTLSGSQSPHPADAPQATSEAFAACNAPRSSSSSGEEFSRRSLDSRPSPVPECSPDAARDREPAKYRQMKTDQETGAPPPEKAHQGALGGSSARAPAAPASAPAPLRRSIAAPARSSLADRIAALRARHALPDDDAGDGPQLARPTAPLPAPLEPAPEPSRAALHDAPSVPTGAPSRFEWLRAKAEEERNPKPRQPGYVTNQMTSLSSASAHGVARLAELNRNAPTPVAEREAAMLIGHRPELASLSHARLWHERITAGELAQALPAYDRLDQSGFHRSAHGVLIGIIKKQRLERGD